MNILLVGADENNSTDGVIVQGIYHILNKTFSNYTKYYLFLDDHNIMNDELFKLDEKYDYILVSGTPWLWDSFQLTPKYKNLKRCFDLHPESKKVFMGIGTCLNKKDEYSSILERPSEIEGMKKLFSNTKVYVRDDLAKYKLSKAGIDSTHIPCPSYFCYGNDLEKSFKNNVLIWCDPEKTISSGDWVDKKKLDNYYRINLEFNKKYNPLIYCALESEKQKAIEIGLPEPKVLNGWQETLDVMKKANYVLSGRVHCAVPAYVKGKALGLLSLDSRSRTLENFGAQIINNVEDLNNLQLTNGSFNNWMGLYKL